MKWNNACEAYWWVYDHPKLIYKGYAHPTIEITPHMVDPTLNGGRGQISDIPEDNTTLQFWVELMYYDDVEILDGVWEEGSCHDWELDCGGWTWEEAVFNIANNVLERYGDY